MTDYAHATHVPTCVYQLVAYGAVPVTLKSVKDYMRVSEVCDDELINSLIATATVWGESYTGREFRANQWTILLDEFPTRIDINRHPVASVESITHIVSGSPVTVTAADYYLKQLTQGAEILLVDGSDWPTDTDEREQAITVSFTTEIYARYASNIADGILRLVSFMYANKGDCPDGDAAIVASGTAPIFDQFRIARV